MRDSDVCSVVQSQTLQEFKHINMGGCRSCNERLLDHCRQFFGYPREGAVIHCRFNPQILGKFRGVLFAHHWVAGSRPENETTTLVVPEKVLLSWQAVMFAVWHCHTVLVTLVLPTAVEMHVEGGVGGV